MSKGYHSNGANAPQRLVFVRILGLDAEVVSFFVASLKNPEQKCRTDDR